MSTTYVTSIFAVILILNAYCEENNGYCYANNNNCHLGSNKYLFYDVNPPEGFNLRRDVYMRYAIFMHKLVMESGFKSYQLVLPPWSFMYHWKRADTPEHIPWSTFFDLESMQSFAPVIEMHTFFSEVGVHNSNVEINQVYVLQHFEEMFRTGKFDEKMLVEKCQNIPSTNFFHYDNVTSGNVKCLSFHGHASLLKDILKTFNGKSILFDHAEVALHENFGDQLYWKCRRSMRFNYELRKIAGEFRKKYLNSTDEGDNTTLPKDWKKEKLRRTARGGPYLGVHLRRRDFARSRPKDVPTIDGASEQIIRVLKKLKLTKVFLATDGSDKEVEELRSSLGSKFQLIIFKPHNLVYKKYGDGGVAIIEQIICSHAQYFLGTHESTFSFRIQEEREILGFPVETTFNRLCSDNNYKCTKPSVWKIVY